MDILSALRKVTASIKTWVDSKLETKLDKNLGADNAGKVLAIGDDGNIKSQMLDTGIIVLSGTNDNPINIDEIKVSGTYLIKGVVTTSMDTTSGSDSAKLNKTFIDGFARGELMSIYSLQDGFVNQLMMNPTRPLVRLDSGEGYSDAIDESYVQPVEKTTEMTQPVGIRSDGQLFTEPFNQVQSDWNENDETNPAYIKNRTHYDNRTEEVLLSSSSENVDCSGLIKISDEVMTLDKLEVSKIEMSLSVNSINFDNAIFDYDGSFNPSESILGVYYHNEDVQMDLVITVYSTNANGSTPGTYLGIDENGTGAYSMKLYREVGELKTLDPKYIKDMYYTNRIEDTFLDGTFDFVDSGGMYYYEQEHSLIIAEGETYTVIFDGTSYSCTSYIPIEGQPTVLGNASIAEPSLPSGNNEPFFIFTGDGFLQIFTNLTSTSHTVKITGLREVIKKLDVKYLPDEIYTAIDTAINTVDSKVDSKMNKVNPAGTGSFSLNRKAGTTVGKNSHAEGYNTTASGENSHAEGYNTTASSMYAHAEGSDTTASGTYSHAEGNTTTASGRNSHTEGLNTTASGNQSHAEGYSSSKFSSVVTTTNPTNDDIITAWEDDDFSLAKGASSHVEGRNSLALGDYSHAEGSATIALGDASHAEGCATTASGSFSHAEGNSTTASGFDSHAEGDHTTASGNYSHAGGQGTVANSTSSLVIGEYNTYDESEFGQKVNKTTKDCSGTYYFGTEFNFNGTTGEFTISGGVTTDDVEVAFDQGKIYMSSDYNASKESDNGYVDSTIYKLVSVENLATLTYNVEKITSVRRAESRATLDNAFAIGNGVTPMDRSNAATVDWSGNAWYAGDVYVGSTSGTNKDEGSKKLATEEYVNSVVPDIPSIPTALPNPYALTFTGAVTGSYDGSSPVSVEIPSGVTDDHINSLIDTKLGVIENGSY